MKVLILGAGSVIHTQRWANGLQEAGVGVVCVSQHGFLSEGWHAGVERIALVWSGPLGYAANAPAVARLFARAGCDILNAHYATGYGLLATLSGVRPRLVSVWGSDVFDFPRTSALHRRLLVQVLQRADAIGSTSEVMARQVRSLLPGAACPPLHVTPFGVDIERFRPRAGQRPAGAGLVVGTVKTLEPKYGVDTLVRGFAALRSRLPGAVFDALTLRIVGGGSQRSALQGLAEELGVARQVAFAGPVAHAAVPAQLHGFDIFVAASRLDSESFGVAVAEASACGLPVVVTAVGGLPEVVADGRTGCIVPKDDPDALAEALARLVGSAALRAEYGAAGRARVAERYAWPDCVRSMIAACEDTVAPTRGGALQQ